MMLGRRGFLHTLAAAAVGAATFDPKSLLWVPAPKVVAPIELVEGVELYRRAQLQLELNDLALRFAQEMRHAVNLHQATALREVMFRHTGNVSLNGLIEIPEGGVGYFQPPPTRLAKTAECGSNTGAFIREMADQMRHDLDGVDVFAPMSAELRPGEPFSDDVLIGVNTDPESGLSARVLRFDIDAPRRQHRTLTMVELAGGKWLTRNRDRHGFKRRQQEG